MKNNNLNRPFFFLLFIVFALGLHSCYERLDACTDVNAANFNPTADDHCCCTYPLLRFQLEHRFGEDSIRFLLDSLYVLESGLSFRLLSLDLLAGKFYLFNETGDSVFVENLLDFDGDLGVNCPCRDDVFVLNPASFSASPGEIASPGEYNGLGFSTGVGSEWDGFEPADFPANHPLAGVERYDTLSQRYFDLRASFVFPQMGSDTLRLRSTHFEEEVSFFTAFNLPRGENKDLRLRIDYKRWFEGLDSAIPDPTQMREVLKSNFQSALLLAE
nr:hypothetical protein [Saprospiraceae bacterium]